MGGVLDIWGGVRDNWGGVLDSWGRVLDIGGGVLHIGGGVLPSEPATPSPPEVTESHAPWHQEGIISKFPGRASRAQNEQNL